MAKGKQAVAAANRRLETANEHIDRLTDAVSEWKIRARAAEKTLSEIGPVVQRVAELERQINEVDTPAISRISELDAKVADQQAALDHCKTLARRYMIRFMRAAKGRVALREDEYQAIAGLVGVDSVSQLLTMIDTGSASKSDDRSNFAARVRFDAKAHRMKRDDPAFLARQLEGRVQSMMADIYETGAFPDAEALTGVSLALDDLRRHESDLDAVLDM